MLEGKGWSKNEQIPDPAPSPTKPAYWSEVVTRSGMIVRGFTAYQLDKMHYGDSLRDRYGRTWWKEVIDKGNENLRPLGSRANTVWCR